LTLVVAHRGASARAPENTMEAFRLAVEAGADAIECDVHLLADGGLAVIHDETIERTTDGRGRVAPLSADDLARLDAGARFPGPDGSFPYRGRGLTVPTLVEVVEWLPAATGPVVELLRGTPVARDGGLAVISFEEAAIEQVHALAPEIVTGYLLVPGQPLEPAFRWALEHGHPDVHVWDGDLGPDPRRRVEQATITYGRRIGCYVVNEPDRMRQLAECRVWGFVTDLPDVAREALGPG
jgi:glycerophosphoryl diester phosphodiesterase